MSGYKGLVLGIAGLVSSMGCTAGDAWAAGEAQVEKPAAQHKFYADDIKSAMIRYIDASVDDEGIFHMHDDKTGEELALEFVRIHDPVRQIDGNTYFACTDFHVVGEPEKLYDLDFWMNGQTGELKVYQSKVHKEPRRSFLYGWYKQPRYTFVDDKIEYLY